MTGLTLPKREQFLEAALLLQGAALGIGPTNDQLAALLTESAALLADAGEHICAQGYYGCTSGVRCTSDHK